MCRFGPIVEQVFSKGVDTLKRTNRRPPNKDALRIYREVVKFCAEFNWKNTDGRVWKDILREHARKEFEQSREERDPVILYKMLLTTREAIGKTRMMVGQPDSR